MATPLLPEGLICHDALWEVLPNEAHGDRVSQTPSPGDQMLQGSVVNDWSFEMEVESHWSDCSSRGLVLPLLWLDTENCKREFVACQKVCSTFIITVIQKRCLFFYII